MTPADIDAVLPRVATWPPKSYDLTDPDERAEVVAWLEILFGEARKHAVRRIVTEGRITLGDETEKVPRWAPVWPQDDEQGSEGTVGADEAEIATWGPPKPGTHESDLCDEGVLCCSYCAAEREYAPEMPDDERTAFIKATVWSREHA